jgi:tetratricopeptide (TPR) repeat protein
LYVRSRLLLYVNVALAALVAAGIVVGITLATGTNPHQPKPDKGKPPVPRDLPTSIGPAIEAAFRNWPHGSIDTMQRLGLEYATPKTAAQRDVAAIVQFYRGIALLWAGYPSDAVPAFEQAKTFGKNTMIHNQADAILHPNYLQTSAPFYPVFVPTGNEPMLAEGSQLQAEGHQVSAETLYARAARLEPGNDQAQVAKAVGLFDEDNLTPAFSHLGPLTQRFPKSQVVRFYLGLLLGWTGQGKAAIAQFRKAVELGPTTALGRESQKFLQTSTRGSGTAPAA